MRPLRLLTRPCTPHPQLGTLEAAVILTECNLREGRAGVGQA
jgi:hypothetical protein